MQKNNFDLIRLFAAFQVLTLHGLIHLKIVEGEFNWALRAWDFVPGVPIFFFTSGFLITAAYQRSPNLVQFFFNRTLRIFPALWVCLALSLLSVWVTGYFDTVNLPTGKFLGWIGAQSSIAHFINPEFMRGYGVGVLNASLWTISVELQFYLLTPVLIFVLTTHQRLYYVGFAIFIVINTFHILGVDPGAQKTTFMKLLSVTFLPWIAIFMLGQLCAFHWERLRSLFEGNALFYLAGYTVLIGFGLTLENATGRYLSGNNILFPWMVVVGGLILALAYTANGLSEKLLRGNDVSYGLYIFHMPVFNFVIHQALGTGWLALLASTATIFVIAWLSWIAIERPALRLKKTALFPR